MSIKIRKGTEKDIEAALNLIKELALYEKAPNEVSVTIEQMKNWGFGSNKIFDFFVLEKNAVVIGLALYYFKYSTWKGKCLFLEDIIITENERKNGYGKLLFNEVAKVAKNENVERMEWQVLNWNEPAIKFYKKYNATLDDEWLNGKLVKIDLQNF
ncbi:MAG: GNAT family N-acetyltransferase [Bacteroidetes bacterium]|nr:GNAT family N-acetyltransferase [Bacteroidota bacterium]